MWIIYNKKNCSVVAIFDLVHAMEAIHHHGNISVQK